MVNWHHRATALLKYKMENDPEIKDLGIQEVYQLQGGIDKYFKQFPDGGFWKGKNYVSGAPSHPKYKHSINPNLTLRFRYLTSDLLISPPLLKGKKSAAKPNQNR